MLLLSGLASGTADACPNCAGIFGGDEAMAYLTATALMLGLPILILGVFLRWLHHAHQANTSPMPLSSSIRGEVL